MEGEQAGWASLTGQQHEAYQGYGWSDAVHPEHVQPTFAAWQEAVKNRSPFDFEHRVKRYDGQWRTCSIRALPLLDDEGHIQEWVGVHTDITELRTLEQERPQLLEAERAARSDAESANSLKDEFLTTLSHELRTPLSVIVGWSRLLQDKFATDSEELKRGVQLISSNAMSQAHIITNLINMSRMSAGKMALDVKPLDLGELLAQCVASHALAAQEKGISLTFEGDPSLSIVMIDTPRLQQMMGNLLVNALKFTPRGGRIQVRTRRAAPGIEILVSDNGEGIAPEFLPQLFPRFRQADGSRARQHGGLGLGLAIVHQLVAMHGGHVRAHSEGRGRGACFTIWLPDAPGAHAAESRDMDRSGSWLLSPDTLANLKGLRVLTVEDQPDMLEQVARVLEERGAHVTSARSAQEALEILRRIQAPFHVLLSDIGMPGMDGLELIRALRQEPNCGTNQLAAVAVTAFTRAEDRARCLAAGFQAHVSKPYDPSSLVALVHQLAHSRPRVAR